MAVNIYKIIDILNEHDCLEDAFEEIPVTKQHVYRLAKIHPELGECLASLKKERAVSAMLRFNVSKSLKEELHLEAEQKGITLSELCRDVLEEHCIL